MRKGTARKIVKAAELGSGVEVDPEAVISVSLRLPAPIYERLRKLSFDKRKPMSEYLIHGVELLLKGEKY